MTRLNTATMSVTTKLLPLSITIVFVAAWTKFLPKK
jgi:hypothetical protein